MRSSNRTIDVLYEQVRRYPRIARLCLLIPLILILVLCWKAGSSHRASSQRSAVVSAERVDLEAEYSDLMLTELDHLTTAAEQYQELDLSGYEDRCEILHGGSYLVRGEMNGTLFINCPEENVHLFLDGVSVTSQVGPALYCEDADKLIITLLPGTESSFSDSGKYLADGELEACVFSTCDMTINGTGALNVNGYYKDAIRSRDRVKIVEGDYHILCKRTGIHGNDGIHVAGGTLQISTEKYGLKTTRYGGNGRGSLIVSGGGMNIIAGRNAFVTLQGDLLIRGCSVTQRSVVSAYDVGGRTLVEQGCVQ